MTERRVTLYSSLKQYKWGDRSHGCCRRPGYISITYLFIYLLRLRRHSLPWLCKNGGRKTGPRWKKIEGDEPTRRVEWETEWEVWDHTMVLLEPKELQGRIRGTRTGVLLSWIIVLSLSSSVVCTYSWMLQGPEHLGWSPWVGRRISPDQDHSLFGSCLLRLFPTLQCPLTCLTKTFVGLRGDISGTLQVFP